MDQSVIFIDETHAEPLGRSTREKTRRQRTRHRRQRESLIDLTDSVAELDNHQIQHETGYNLRSSQRKEQRDPMNETTRCQRCDNYDSFFCPVCLESFVKKEYEKVPIMALACGHVYCLTCLNLLRLQLNKKCAVCQTDVGNKSPLRLFF